MFFDARAAKLLKPGNHIVVDGCPGLRLTATETRKTWGYRYKSPVTGQMKQVKIGAWPAMSAGDAAEKWQELRARRDSGEAVKVPKPVAAVDTSYTLGRMIEDYASGYLAKRREPKGAKAVHQRLKNAVPDAGIPITEVTRRFVFDLVESLSDRPVMAGSVKTEMAAAHAYALDAGRIDDEMPNWWALVAKRKLRSMGALRDGKHKGTAKRTLSDAEIATLFAVDMARFSQQVQDFLALQLWTCTRGAEIVQMRREHITTEPDGVWWTIPKAMTKGAHRAAATDLRAPLIGRALAIVQRLESRGGWLFPSTSRAGKIQHQEQTYMQTKVHYLQPYSKARPDHIRERLTVTHWSPHDLRRTGRTLLAALGCPNEVGEAILGHVQPGIVGTYNLHKYSVERRQWLTALDARLESIIRR